MTQSDSNVLHEPSAIRIAYSEITGGRIAELLKSMAREAHEAGLEGNHVVISYIEEGDEFVPGTYVPEIHLILRQVADDTDQDEED